MENGMKSYYLTCLTPISGPSVEPSPVFPIVFCLQGEETYQDQG
jgi:hypothetical protein